MKFQINKNEIYQIIQQAYSFTSIKNIETILQNILIEAIDNKIYFKTSNIMSGYEAYIEKHVNKEGKITVSCKKLLEILKELPTDADIDFDFNDNKLHIKTNSTSFSLSTIDPSVFPTMSDITPEYYVKIKGDKLLNLLNKTYFCIANEASKISYKGAHFKIIGNKIEVSSSDFQRIAIANDTLDDKYFDEFIINIPKRTIMELSKIIDCNIDIEMETDKKQVLFKIGNKIIYSNLIGSYISSLNKLFESQFTIKIKMSRDKIFTSLKRVATITNEINHGVVFSFKGESLKISSMETEYGYGNETLDGIKKIGKDISFIFNARLFLEIISHINSDYFYLHLVGSKNPVIISPDEEGYKYLMVTISLE